MRSYRAIENTADEHLGTWGGIQQLLRGRRVHTQHAKNNLKTRWRRITTGELRGYP